MYAKIFTPILFFCVAAIAFADHVEMLNGTTVEGMITGQDDRFVSIDVAANGKTFVRKYAIDRVHAVVQAGKRTIVTPKNSDEKVGQTLELTLDQRIAEAGRTLPAWWDDTKLDIPPTLDLSYPAPVPGKPLPWNNQKNIGQFVWDIVNPNPGRWRSSGIRLFHHLLELHKDDPTTLQRVRNELGMMYFRFEQDYARAAYWLLQAGADRPDFPFFSAVPLAECFWKLGDKPRTLRQLETVKDVSPGLVKLLASMGETKQALDAAQKLVAWNAPVGYVSTGDVYRVAGRNKEALDAYAKAVAAVGGNKRLERFKRRAEENILGLKAFEMLDLSKVADGKYRGESSGFDGPLHVEITMMDHRIADVRVTEHHEKQFYSSLSDTCRQIKEKQGLRDIDATSGATITSEAIVNAAAKALTRH